MKHLIALITLFLVLPVAHAELSISESSVNFNDTPVDGLGKSTDVFVKNLSSKAAHVQARTKGCSDNFYLINACNITLDPNQMCKIAIRFQPYEFGHLSCNIEIQDSLGDSGMIEINGRGVQPN